ncbi:MAG: 4-hydroxy-tetrahydrodipicolinate reductase, partial [Firmicutes bacterium]|nr:4-hydroxy-tetrahydrodipicolinate reductase [Bacillota bacterium]
GPGETLTLKHEALDRGLFSAGAVKAMKFALAQEKPGLFGMGDVMFLTEKS